MGAAIGLRDDFDGVALRRLARTTKSANQGRRLLMLAEIYDGASRGFAGRIGGVGLQIVRDWVVRFNARGPDGLLDGKAHGKRSMLNDAQRRALVAIVESGPIPAIHGVVRWRLIDLVRWLHEEFSVSLDETTVRRELKKLGYLAMGGQIIDATIVPAPRQRNSRDDNATVKSGETPAEWENKPAKNRQKDKVARWTKRRLVVLERGEVA